MQKSFQNDKNCAYFIVIALVVAQLFKIVFFTKLEDLERYKVDTNFVKSQRTEDFFCIKLTFCTVILFAKFHDMSSVKIPWQHNGRQALSIQGVK